ncbi:MAG: PEPxxWA-CTERM sorting domain-containing protein [Sphingomonadales bacterium]|nr:PEPxxWA-CTERM sorting domain-containing protein [Sphingomonadales bacterium]
MSFRFALRGALVAACLFSTPALADTFLAEFRDLGGTTTMARFDLATGNALSGVRLDANPTGDNAPIPWGGIGGFAFEPEPGTSAIPEPASWAMLICGIAVVGGLMRRKGEGMHFVAFASAA